MLKIDRTEKEGVHTVTITTDDSDAAEYMELDAQHWQETKEFREKMKDVKPREPTQLEQMEMQHARYTERLRQLKVFIEKVPNQREFIGIACRMLLKSIYGSRDRAIQAWMMETVTREDLEGKKT